MTQKRKEKEVAKAAVKDVKPAPVEKGSKKELKEPLVEPKKPLSAFFIFQGERRESLKKEKATLNHKEIISKMSEEWTKFTDKQKEKYQKMADAEKAKYAKEKEVFEKAGGVCAKKKMKGKTEAASGKGGKVKKLKVDDGIKKPLSSFFIF
jgi:high mobility group protein B3